MSKERFIKMALWVAGVFTFFVALSFAERKITQSTVLDIVVNIEPTKQGNFISEVDVSDRLNDFYPPSLHGKNIKKLNLLELDSLVESSPFIKTTTAYSNLNGQLFIDVVQEVPLLRILNKTGGGFYVSNEGKKLPLSVHRAAKVPIANGNISEEVYPTDSLSTSTLKDLYRVALFLDKSPFFKALTGQLFVDNNKDIILITKQEERHDINLGNAENLEEKFDNLYQFYTKVLPIKGWDTYKTINLKYKNQIVAKK